MKFYCASKVWHAAQWRDAQDMGYPITSRWIHYDDDSDIVLNRKGELWQHCLEDVTAADAVIIYCGSRDEEQRGAVMEAGHAMGQGKPVYCINSCKTFSPCSISDVAFTHHPLWNWVRPGEWLDFWEGIVEAHLQMLTWHPAIVPHREQPGYYAGKPVY